MNSESGATAGREQEMLRLSADVVAAYLSQNAVPANAIPELIRSIHQTMTNLDRPVETKPQERQKPAVPPSRSIHDDYIVCLEDGKKLKMLKRYLRSKFDMSPEDYRRKWGLAPDYPMVAPAYAARRSDFAKQIGLGKGVRRRRG